MPGVPVIDVPGVGVIVPPVVEVTPEGPKPVPGADHKNQKPPRDTRELKLKVLAHHSIVGRIWGGLTEFSDLVDAFYEALPEDIRKKARQKRHGKDPKLETKVLIIWDFMGQMDQAYAQRVAWNIGVNQFEDFAIGKANQKVNKAFSKAPHFRNRPVGIGFGPVL